MTLPEPPTDLPELPGSFKALKVTYPPTTAFPHTATHVIYLQPHTPAVPTATSSRSLFVTNLPIDWDLPHLRALLGDGIQSVEEAGMRTAGIVVFETNEQSRAAYKSVEKSRRKKESRVWGEGVSELKKHGLEAYKSRFLQTHPDKELLSNAINMDLAEFSQKESESIAEARRRANMVDEDGFTMVVRGAKVREREEDEAAAPKKKRKSEDTTQFYRFQMRESRKEKAKELVERWEVDRKRLEERKAKRHLRPL